MDPQKKAIETIDRCVAVNAGAGTGKTKVLTERFVYILEHGKLEEGREVESIVAITFTKKATQEMVERIRSEIRKRFGEGNKWARFYRDMEKSNISTIHSFCGKILRENPIEAKVDPLFNVLDDSTSKDLLNESIMEALKLGILNELYDFMLLLKEFRPENLIGDLTEIYNQVRTVGMSFENVKKSTMDYLDNLRIDTDDLKIIKDTIIYLQGKLAKNSNIVKLHDDSTWIKFRDDEYSNDELFHILEYLNDRLGTSKKEEEKFNLLRTSIDRVLISKESKFKWMYNCFLDLLILIDKLYTEKKDKISGLDYDDLQLKVLRLFDNIDIKEKYQAKYKYIMIDEFQDTNELQKNIFYKLATKDKPLDQNNLFVVGDPKQSIYAFRGADIDVFYNVLNDIKNITNEKNITLSKNYRTVNTVLEFINDVFQKLMESRYDSLEPFHTSENKIDIEVLENTDYEASNEDSIIYEADLIAKRIKTLVDEGKYNYRDFALLFRATTRNYYYEEALKKYNIPIYNSSSKQFFKRQEILDILNALKTISNPFDTVSSIGFLRGPMVGVSDITIFHLLSNNEISLYNTIERYFYEPFADLPQDEVENLKNAKNLLEYLYSIKDISSLSYILERLLDKTNFMQVQLLMNNGKQSLANIYKFMHILENYENNNMKSLEDFIDYIEDIKNDAEAEGIIESEDSNVVKLLTIHKSKGLQFPVVIIPEMAKDMRINHPRFLFNKKIGIGIKTDETKGIYEKIKSELDGKEKEEYKRILYVAMTRAKNMLILGAQGKIRGFKAMIKDIIDPNFYNSIKNIDLNVGASQHLKLIQPSNISDKNKEIFHLPLLGISNITTKRFERFSISQFLNFRRCKRSFYLDYYKKLSISNTLDFDEIETKADGLVSALDKGNIVHKFCELYDNDTDIRGLLDSIANSYGVILNEDIYAELQPYINNYLNYINNDNYDKVYIEKPFFLKLGESYVSGVIDRVNFKNNEIEIVDFKTNKLNNKRFLANHYQPQLGFYAYAMEKIMKVKVSKSSIIFLEDGEEVSIDISDEVVSKNVQEIEKFISFVNQHNNIVDYLPSNDCNEYCRHKNICGGIDI
ncbi:UvrD-helicase domain-containing protein [Tissierella sp. Yu-01]|uniref:UvrD-helicase domain-containing protein n=1 Tax=Tissierella sp. Yu-01 TaxID=3035694 RepID=UPI00240D81C3|nr:UvrD-helicase domain-containing protein [Tissierella sp. Yu-01]WFA09411.1 UvrD-helicase domain-containing protein [Tissierella sp. Yu-01]